jgi:heme/copper-type cytochrome/quinol oxidase subunit 4
VTSDPVTAADLTAIIIGASMILTAALIAFWVALGGGTYTLVGAIILAALAIAGVLVILTVFITKGAEALLDPLVWVFAMVALGIGGYVAYEYFKGAKRRATA